MADSDPKFEYYREGAPAAQLRRLCIGVLLGAMLVEAIHG